MGCVVPASCCGVLREQSWDLKSAVRWACRFESGGGHSTGSLPKTAGKQPFLQDPAEAGGPGILRLRRRDA